MSPADTTTDVLNETLRLIPLNQIQPNRFQPRRDFNEAELQELADNIAEEGLLQPIPVRFVDGEGQIQFEIIAGERRYRAHKLLGKNTIKCLIKEDVDDATAMQSALIENIQRDDLNPMEEARAIVDLMSKLNLKQDEVGAKLSKSRTYISQMVRLPRLPEIVQDLISADKLNAWQGVSIAGLDSEEDQITLAEKAVKGNWNTDTVRKRVAAVKEAAKPEHKKKKTPIATLAVGDHIILFECTDAADVEANVKVLEDDGFKVWQGRKAIEKALAKKKEEIEKPAEA